MGGAVRTPYPVRRGPPSLRGGALLVPGGASRPRAAVPVRRAGLRVDGSRLQPDERTPLRRPALARQRDPNPERLRLHQLQLPSPTKRRSPAGRSSSRYAAATTTSIGKSSTTTGWRRSRPRRVQLRALEVPALPEYEDESIVTAGRGLGTSHLLLAAYDRLLEGLDRVLHYHFELLNLGYGAYLAFYELCRSVFPGIEDRTLASMVAGIDVLVLRPDDELRRLARPRAASWESATLVRGARTEAELRAALAGSDAGSTVAGRLRGDQGSLVLLLLRDRRLLPPPPLVDRRPDDPDHDDRGVHRAARRRRGHRTSAGGDPGGARADHRRAPRAAARGAARRLRREPASRQDRVPVRREPQFLRRPPVPDDLLEQGARVRRAARDARRSWPTARTSSSSATTRSAPHSRTSGSPGAAARRRRTDRRTGRRSWRGAQRSTRR